MKIAPPFYPIALHHLASLAMRMVDAILLLVQRILEDGIVVFPFVLELVFLNALDMDHASFHQTILPPLNAFVMMDGSLDRMGIVPSRDVPLIIVHPMGFVVWMIWPFLCVIVIQDTMAINVSLDPRCNVLDSPYHVMDMEHAMNPPGIARVMLDPITDGLDSIVAFHCVLHLSPQTNPIAMDEARATPQTQSTTHAHAPPLGLDLRVNSLFAPMNATPMASAISLATYPNALAILGTLEPIVAP